MNRALLTVTWVLVILASVLGATLAWQRLHPRRSHDQQILLDKAK